MENDLASLVLHVCQALNQYAVRYLVVGGTAVAFHGYFRHSVNAAGVITDKPGLDFWYDPTYANYFQLLQALQALGQNVAAYQAEQAPNPRKSFFRYDLEHFTLDFLPEIKASLKFEATFTKRHSVTLRGTDIPFLSYDDLLLDKAANARPKDQQDVKQLRDRRNTE